MNLQVKPLESFYSTNKEICNTWGCQITHFDVAQESLMGVEQSYIVL